MCTCVATNHPDDRHTCASGRRAVGTTCRSGGGAALCSQGETHPVTFTPHFNDFSPVTLTPWASHLHSIVPVTLTPQYRVIWHGLVTFTPHFSDFTPVTLTPWASHLHAIVPVTLTTVHSYMAWASDIHTVCLLSLLLPTDGHSQ